MARTGEGRIEIDLADFWQFVHGYLANSGDEVSFGVPRFNVSARCLEIDYAYGSDGHPDEWAEGNAAKRQWEALKAERDLV